MAHELSIHLSFQNRRSMGIRADPPFLMVSPMTPVGLEIHSTVVKVGVEEGELS